MSDRPADIGVKRKKVKTSAQSPYKRRLPARVASCYTIDSPTKNNLDEIKKAAVLLCVPVASESSFVTDICEALSFYQVSQEELDKSATPSEISAGLGKIKEQTERLRRRTGFSIVNPTLKNIIDACDYWRSQLESQIKPGRRPKGALAYTVMVLRMTIFKHAPTSLPTIQQDAACICLDAASIKYPDRGSHSDRFNALFGE